MSVHALSGDVSKATILVSPQYAQEKELLQFIKYKLYDAGFIVIREEYRRINAELAHDLCVQYDYIPEYFNPRYVPPVSSRADSAGTSPEIGDSKDDVNAAVAAAAATAAAAAAAASAGGSRAGSGSYPYSLPSSLLPTDADMVGIAYIYIVAHRDCHAALTQFLLETLLGCGGNTAATPPAIADEGDNGVAMTDSNKGSGAAAAAEEEDEVTFSDLVAAIAEKKGLAAHSGGDDDEAAAGMGIAAAMPPPAVFINRTADGTRKAVNKLFPRMLVQEVPNPVQSREYVQAQLKTTLLPALTELAKQKPSDPLRWLADYLIMTNPHSPPMVNDGE